MVENHPDFYQPVAAYLAQTVAGSTTLITSVITYIEFCVKPEQVGRLDIILDFDLLLRDLEVQVLEVSLAVATLAYKLRAKYTFLKSMDALQLAAAMHAGCDGFLTNDKKLKGIGEVPVLLVSAL